MKQKTKLFFLNLDIGKNLTGIESSALSRAQLFYENLGLESVYLSIYFNPFLTHNFASALAPGRAYAHLQSVNMYDWFQQATNAVQHLNFQFQPAPAQSASPLDNSTKDLRVFEKGVQVGYVAHHSETKTPTYHNHLHDGQIWRRDWYDSRGFVSRTEYVDLENFTLDGRYEHYYRPNGSTALVRLYRFNKDNKRQHRITQRLDHQGRTVAQYQNESEMIFDFLLGQVDKENINVFFVDRCKEYYLPLKKLQHELGACVKVVPIIHSTHYVHQIQQAGDPMTSPISEYFIDMLQDMSTADAVVTFTVQQCAHIRARFGDGNLVVIPHAHKKVEIDKDILRDRFKVVMLGRFAEEKQHQLAIEAFQLVVSAVPSAQLHLYGYGDKHRAIIDTVERLQMSNHVFIHEFQHEVEPIFRTAGLSLSTSRNEGFGLSIMESLFFGCPVVSFDCNYGPAAMIQDGVNGYLIKPQDVQALADRIVKVLSDEALHSNLVAQTSASMESFTSAAVAQQWQSLLSQIGAVAT